MSTLLVASTGGHLAQLHRLSRRMPKAAQDRTWVTFDTPQSRSLLAGEKVEYVRYTAPRDWRSVARNAETALRLLSSGDFSYVVSTGSGIALSFLPLARTLGIPCTYIESAARSDGPSLTGRILQRAPGVDLATQYLTWPDDRWRYAGSVFDEFRSSEQEVNRPVKRVLVTLGTIKYDFSRLVDRTLSIVPPDVDVVMQTGSTDVRGTGADTAKEWSSKRFMSELHQADAVIAHAGTGSALSAFEAGKSPILVPRRADHGEHVDDHQRQIAAEISSRGLGFESSVDELSWGLVERAARRAIRPVTAAPPIRLQGDLKPARRPRRFAVVTSAHQALTGASQN